MSLVEKAMSRLRKADGSDGTDSECAQYVTAPIPVLDHPEKQSRRLTVDVNGLRAGGYLPEADKDRQFADHYRQIKRPLIKAAFAANAGVPGEPRVIMVTSALPGDGKTFTSINLAFSLARERDLSVLLVDGDLLKPHVSRIFGVQNEPGLTDALTDDSLTIDSLIVETNVRGFSILPAGTPVEGTSELLSSNRMRQLMKAVCAQNPRRLLLIDSPPLLITNEGKTLISVAGQVVLVVRAGLTPRQAILDAVDLFDEKQLGGIVLNDAHMGAMHGYYGYGYGSYGIEGDGNPPKR